MGRNHSATTFTKKLAVISGCRATVAGKSPVVLIGSTVMFFGLTSTLEESAMAIFSAEMPPNSLPDSETLAAISTVELDDFLGGNSLFAGGDGLGQTSALHGLDLGGGTLDQAKARPCGNR